ncbi:unnamed protein product [Polarella glacialis]|uniref:Uncharacterized protein n=1 Tax=Polarella glacialis TaxID=89957 RepID=A0A813FK34_POLGL|nr:unnamed protein product [Polarella glacialis]
MNPPFMPNPDNIASGASTLFGNGGDTGEEVLSAAVAAAGAGLLKLGGRFVAVSKAPNVEDLPERLKDWWRTTPTRQMGLSAMVFRGPPTPAARYLPTALSSAVEPVRYQLALKRSGILTLSQAIMLLWACDGGEGAIAAICGEPRPGLWLDDPFLRSVVQSSTMSTLGGTAVTTSPMAVEAREPLEEDMESEGKLAQRQHSRWLGCQDSFSDAVADTLEALSIQGAYDSANDRLDTAKYPSCDIYASFADASVVSCDSDTKFVVPGRDLTLVCSIRAGKKLLEQHGEDASIPILAKKTSMEAAQSDVDCVYRVDRVIKQYEEAAASLRKAMLLPKVEGITGYDEFKTLAEAYEQRVKSYQQVKELLGTPMASLPMTPVEKDALALLQVKGGYNSAKSSAMESVEAAKKMSTAASQKACA